MDRATEQTASMALVGSTSAVERAYRVGRQPSMNVSFVVVNPAAASSRHTYHNAIRELCADLYLNCRLYFFADEAPLPERLPLSSASMRRVAAVYEQNGQNGSTSLTFYRDGKPVDP